jgi:hypothetical protein
MGLNPTDDRENKAEYRELTVEIKQLKRELNRKEKALAGASDLLILKKKPHRWSKKIRNWAMVEQVFLNPKHSQKKAA